MNASALGATALAATLPVHALLILSGAVAALVLLVYTGIVMPAVWSAKPARRKAAAAVLCQILDAWTSARKVTRLEQAQADLTAQLEERTEELRAAREANRELPRAESAALTVPAA